jgi:NitT/TauT family transport system permease protein
MKVSHFDHVLLVAGILIAWQLFYFAVGDNVVSSPFETLSRAAALVQTGAFWSHAASTGTTFGIASVLSIVGGIILGLWFGLRRFAGDVADPIMGTFYSIPKITLYPIILLICGLGLSAKIAFGTIHGIFPVAIFTMNAVRNVAPTYQRTARMMRLSPVMAAATIMAPAALPEILTGVRVGIALTMFGTIIGELFASTSGIGFAIMRATSIHNVTDILALTLLLFLFAATVNAFFHYLERRVHHGG